VNEAVAKPLGTRLECCGWEDEPPGDGRPQELINKYVDDCDWAVFVLNERWGTPTGDYSSGFQEEFERARNRLDSGEPIKIALFFRVISSRSVADPGPQLSQNLKFRDRIFKEQCFLAKTYADADEFQELITRYLSQWTARGEFETELEAPASSVLSIPSTASWGRGTISEAKLLKDAEKSMVRGTPAQAESNTRLFLESTDSPEARKLLAWSLYEQGRYKEALHELSTLLRSDPYDVTSLLNESLLLRRLGHNTEALTETDRAIEIAPDHADCHRARGYILGELDRWDEAVIAFSAALDLKSDKEDRAVLLTERGVAYGQSGRAEKGIEDNDSALKLSPNMPQAFARRGAILATLGRYDEALADFKKADKHGGPTATTARNRASALIALDRCQDALDALEGLSTKESESHLTWYLRGKAFYDLKKRTEALDSFDRVLLHDPSDTGARSRRGVLRYYDGDMDGAARDLTIVARSTDNDSDWFSVACLAITVGNKDQAADTIAHASSATVSSEPEETLLWFQSALAAITAREDDARKGLNELSSMELREDPVSRQLSDMYAAIRSGATPELANLLELAGDVLQGDRQQEELADALTLESD